MRLRRLSAVFAALALGAGSAAACGNDDISNREQPDEGNPGVQAPQGGNTVTETGPTTLGSTGEDQPDVTQPETGP